MAIWPRFWGEFGGLGRVEAYVGWSLGGGVRWLDRRLLMGVLVAVFATGVPLAVWFDGDAARSISWLHGFLRAAHAVSTMILVAGTLVHAWMRIRSSVNVRAMRRGAWAVASVGLATWTGVMADQTGLGALALARVGLTASSASGAAVVHVAMASVLVALTVYLHVAGKAWGRLFGSWQHAAIVAGLVGLGAFALPFAVPGDATGHWASAVLMAGGVPWPLVLGIVLALGLSIWRPRASSES